MYYILFLNQIKFVILSNAKIIANMVWDGKNIFCFVFSFHLICKSPYYSCLCSLFIYAIHLQKETYIIFPQICYYSFFSLFCLFTTHNILVVFVVFVPYIGIFCFRISILSISVRYFPTTLVRSMNRSNQIEFNWICYIFDHCFCNRNAQWWIVPLE